MSEPTPPPEPIRIQPEISPKPTPESRPAKPKLSRRAKIWRWLGAFGLATTSVGGGYAVSQTEIGKRALDAFVNPPEPMTIVLSDEEMGSPRVICMAATNSSP